jgi:hypothetical protein
VITPCNSTGTGCGLNNSKVNRHVSYIG